MFVNMRRVWSAAVSAGVAVVAVAAGQLVAAAPAHASAAQQVISGTDAVADDFGDEATLSRYGQYRHSNAVALWQEILQAEGLYSGAIDCDFGPGTESGTVAYQRKYGLSSKDGIVGPETWRKAQSFLKNGGSEDQYLIVLYDPTPNGDFADFHRSTSNTYYSVYLPGRAWVTAWDNYASPSC